MNRMFGALRPKVAAALVAGLVALGLAATVLVGTAAAGPALLTPGTPCSLFARACVDLGAQQAWLIDNGVVARGPVPISTGGPGRETPRGDFDVEWKNLHHKSAEFNGAPMPYAVFFAPGGIAFHQGVLGSSSAGCVRLNEPDAAAFYGHLLVGDEVEVR